MKKAKYLSWHSYFMSIALLSSFRSKDAKTQNGACIVDANHKIIGIGYNGLPSGCDDNDPQYWEDDDSNLLRSKHTYVVHAEKNAIYNCMAQHVNHATLYTTQFPCNTCAQAIIQVGIKQVIYLRQKQHNQHQLINEAVWKMFNDVGVKADSYRELDIADHQFIDDLAKIGRLGFD